jgi:hypothetical protein
MIKCEICHTEFQQLNATHLRKHSTTIAEYKERFPDAPIMKPVEWSDERREAARQRRLGKKHSQVVRDKIGAGNKGKIMSLEAIAKNKESNRLARKANGGGFATGPRSDEFKARMSEIAKTRTPEQIQTKVEQMWAARRGQIECDEVRGKKRDAQVRRMVETPEKIGIRFFDTIPELEFAAELDRLGVSYTKQFHTSKPHFLYDFKVGENILVEIDGPYHYNPKMYKTDEAWIEAKSRDEMKNLNAINQGFDIGRIKVEYHLPNDWQDILESQGILIQKDPE